MGPKLSPAYLGGTRAPLMLDCEMWDSWPKTKAEWQKPDSCRYKPSKFNPKLWQCDYIGLRHHKSRRRWNKHRRLGLVVRGLLRNFQLKCSWMFSNHSRACNVAVKYCMGVLHCLSVFGRCCKAVQQSRHVWSRQWCLQSIHTHCWGQPELYQTWGHSQGFIRCFQKHWQVK